MDELNAHRRQNIRILDVITSHTRRVNKYGSVYIYIYIGDIRDSTPGLRARTRLWYILDLIVIEQINYRIVMTIINVLLYSTDFRHQK